MTTEAPKKQWKIGDGRPKGAKNRKPSFAIEWACDNLEAVLEACKKAALAGDAQAIKVLMGLACPPRRDRPIEFEMPKIRTLADAVDAAVAVLQAVGEGKITPLEGGNVLELFERAAKIGADAELEARLKALEDLLKKREQSSGGAWSGL